MADQLKCCICGEPASPSNVIGGRAYCDRHFAQVNKPHRGFWRTAFIQIAIMGVFSAIVAALADTFTITDRNVLILVGLLLAIIPTAWWLFFFYREDQLEPEPKTRIAAVFGLALLLTDSVGLRVINGLFDFETWSVTNQITSLLGSILVVGFVLMAIEYFAVRVVVYATDEFDERMDGIVYGTTAGLGIATLLNLHHIIDNQGVALGPGVIYVVTTALAQASFGGLMGYFMAQAKFEHKPVWWVPTGLAISAILLGFFRWLIDEVSANGLTVDPWRSLIFGLIVALATFAVLIALMRRANRLTLTPSGTGS